MNSLERFHGGEFPPLVYRKRWIAKLRELRPHLTDWEAMKEWQNRRCDHVAAEHERRKLSLGDIAYNPSPAIDD